MTPLARLPHAPARAFSTCGRGNARCNCLSGQRRVRMQPPISTCALALVASQPLPTLTPLPTQQPQQPRQPRQPQQSKASRKRCTLAFALTLTLTLTRTAIARAPRVPEQNNKARLVLRPTNRSLGAANAFFDLRHSALLLLLHPPSSIAPWACATVILHACRSKRRLLIPTRIRRNPLPSSRLPTHKVAAPSGPPNPFPPCSASRPFLSQQLQRLTPTPL
jgi:hypothetical protein